MNDIKSLNDTIINNNNRIELLTNEVIRMIKNDESSKDIINHIMEIKELNNKNAELTEQISVLENEADNEYFSVEVNLDDYCLSEDGILTEESVKIDGIGMCKISVYINLEGDNEPHMHIVSKDEVCVNGRDKIFDGCIKLHKAEFFPHAQHTDTFKMLKGKKSKNAAVSFNNFMNSKDKSTNKQMWKVFVDRWLDNHKDVRNLKDMKNKPNYKHLV